MIRKVAIGLTILIMVVLAGGYLLPETTKLKRSIVINAPIQTVFGLVNNLKASETWSPWKDEDASMVTTYADVVEGVGAKSSWTSDDMGSGSMTIIDAKENEFIRLALEFGDQGVASSEWKFEPGNNGVIVTWAFETKNGANPIKRYISELLAKPMIEKSYDKGLGNLKRTAEEIARNHVEEEPTPAQPSKVTN